MKFEDKIKTISEMLHKGAFLPEIAKEVELPLHQVTIIQRILQTIDELYEIYENKDYEKFTQKLHWYFAVLDLAILNKLEDEALEISNLLVCITDEMIKVRKDEK